MNNEPTGRQALGDSARLGSSERLKAVVADLASEFGYGADCNFVFRFPEVSPSPGRSTEFRPDCVWFAGAPIEINAMAIFEIDHDTSRKHRVGGVVLANIVALKLLKQLRYFAIAPENHVTVATSPIALHRRYLGEQWRLEATVIATFDPDAIRARVRNALKEQS